MLTDPLLLALIAIMALFLFTSIRNGRKRKAQAEELKTQLVPGAEVLTTFGLYGTLVSVDEVAKVAELELSPGNVVRIHSQTIGKVVPEDADTGEPRSVEEAMERATREQELREQQEAEAASEPEFGERIDVLKPKKDRRPAKKADE